MSNSYYNAGSFPATGTPATSASMRAELALISGGFDRLPALSGNANKLVLINGAETGMTVLTPPAGDLVGTTATQTLTNKTISGTFTGSLTGAASLNVLKAGDTMTGNLVINTGVDSRVLLQSSGTTQGQIQTTGALVRFASNNALPLVLSTNGVDRATLDDVGNITFGSASATGVFKVQGNNTNDLAVFESTDASASAAPDVVLYRNSASPAVSDQIGVLIWRGKDSGGADQQYARLGAEITDPTAGSEDADLWFETTGAGVAAERMRLNAAGLSLASTSDLTLNKGTVNGILYLNGSKVATSGSALTFDGSTFGVLGSTGASGAVASFTTVDNPAAGRDFLRFIRQGVGTVGGIEYSEANSLGVNSATATLFKIGSAEQMRLTSTGLGIGTSSPGAKLDVNGAARLRAGNTLYFQNAAADANATIVASGGAGSSDLAINAGGGNLGIGTSSPYSGTRLTLQESASSPSALAIRNRNSTQTWQLSVDAAAIDDKILAFIDPGAGVVRMALDSSGNLGIGVTPSAWNSSWKALDIGSGGGGLVSPGAADTRLYNNSYADAGGAKYKTTGVATVYVQGAGHSWFTAPSGTAGNAITFTQSMTLDASGNLLVGNTFAIFGTAGRGVVESNGSSSAIFGLGVGGTAAGYVLHDGSNMEITQSRNGYMRFLTNNTERARITSGGDLLVGTTDAAQTSGAGFKVGGAGGAGVGQVAIVDADSTNSTVTYRLYSTGAAAYRFYVGLGGTIYATSATITSLSDQRLKENIQNIDVGLNAIMALKPRKFDWKAGKGKDIKGDRGFIAQEFEQVFPDMVDTWQDPAPEGEEPYKAVNADLIPVLVKAMQEQQALITALTARVAQLERQA